MQHMKEQLLARAAWFDKQIRRITHEGWKSYDTSVTPAREDTQEYLKELIEERAGIALLLSLIKSESN